MRNQCEDVPSGSHSAHQSRPPKIRSAFFFASLWTAASLIALPASADTPAVDQRDAMIFGQAVDDTAASKATESDEESDQPASSSESTATSGHSSNSREDAIFGGGLESDPASGSSIEGSLEQRLSDRLEEANDKLAIGGFLFTQAQYDLFEDGGDHDDSLSAPAILEAYLDARPNERLRVYTEARLSHQFIEGVNRLDPTGENDRAPTDIDLDQLWLKFDIARTLYVTLGRQHLRWSVGRVWHPNDFLFAERRDPTSIVDTRVGADLLKLHAPVPDWGANFYATANFADVTQPRELGGGFRAEVLIDRTELGVSTAIGRDRPFQVGADISTGLPWFELRAEGNLTNGLDTRFWRGNVNFESFRSPQLSDWTLPQVDFRENQWIPQGLLALESSMLYGDQDRLDYGVEYFYNGQGYASEELYPWLFLTGQFSPLYNSRHYGAVYLNAPSPGSWNDTSLNLLNLVNLSDWSVLSRVQTNITVLTHLHVFASAEYGWGSRGEFNFRVEVPPLPLGGFQNGLTLTAQHLSLALGASLSF